MWGLVVGVALPLPYYLLCRDRLVERGVATRWVPVALGAGEMASRNLLGVRIQAFVFVFLAVTV